MWWLLAVGLIAIVALAVFDLTQKRRAILRNFPLLGHFRYWLEAIGPELRQYIVTSNDEERPFSRDHRHWIYTSAEHRNNYFGFGSDNEMDQVSNYLIVKHDAFPLADPQPGSSNSDPEYRIPCAKVLGRYRKRQRQFRPTSCVNVSAMSYGSLSGPAVEAINRGCASAGCLHNTGEGGISPYHQRGGELIWQIGTGYFGCRNQDGTFSLSRLLETVQAYPQVRAIEIKLSQGAKPGLGGILPGDKVTTEIARIRGIEPGVDCISPNSHSAFRDPDSLLDFVEEIADASGLPVGIKSAVGELAFWRELALLMATTERSVDFITIDGGEGGTGAAPLAFSDHVALPFKVGFTRVYRELAAQNIPQNIALIGSGKLGLPESAFFAFGLGCDMIAVAREAMLAIGCIQAQRCHSGHCPSGVATQNRWLEHGLDASVQSVHFANYVRALRKELLRLSRACGVPHPSLATIDHFEILDGHFGAHDLAEIFGYGPEDGLPSLADQLEVCRLMEGEGVRHRNNGDSSHAINLAELNVMKM
jgi:glutamate synthase domain-containing protein 2